MMIPFLLFVYFYTISTIIAYVFEQFSCSEKAALQALKASDWHLEGAFDVFYSQPHIRTSTDTRHLEELYNRYKGKT